MLGGYGHVSDGDQLSSIDYIKRLKLDSKGIALDVGAGIGRVSKNVLLPCFAKGDILEANAGFAEKVALFYYFFIWILKGCDLRLQARTYVDNENLEHIFVKGMEDFTPEVPVTVPCNVDTSISEDTLLAA